MHTHTLRQTQTQNQKPTDDSITLGIGLLGIQPALRRKALKVENIEDPIVQQIIESMLHFSLRMGSVGISAPQFGIPLQISIITSSPNAEHPDAPYMEPLAMINPVIIVSSTALVSGLEGCMSTPSLFGEVWRYEWVVVSFTNQKGEQRRIRLEGHIARIFLHEFDHLQGILFIDHACSS